MPKEKQGNIGRERKDVGINQQARQCNQDVTRLCLVPNAALLCSISCADSTQ
jgi:hypothetical protein